MKYPLIKALTIILFSFSIISFVAYRSGYFGGSKSIYSISPNGGSLNNSVDSTEKAKPPRMMPSSKVSHLG